MKEENNWFSNTKLRTNYDLWRSVGRPTKSIWLLATSYISVIWICGNKSWSLGKTKAIPLPGHKWPLAKKRNEIAFHAPTLMRPARNGIFRVMYFFTPLVKILIIKNWTSKQSVVSKTSCGRGTQFYVPKSA